ncbi:T9SS type B sorting domain-containing protein [Capnocytophaga catalasegens]|uniref:HYR domain-containing protein n=1 Tax=Capnocytophaga catalasegens TaxID=1004260 RepID=A0AAV5AXR8_9FLAO|nr:T9SS type B sorting domain-containing protein [Capnocytophaga catalasegens]GIZ14409.1 hypothetical protein RCZ03_04100 [Capnocytophaga catalasegens]GJM51529.1 hypothetical protein RCZ15_25020 [Capnocytophaga catalasegens]GJM53433.1 hypothetical protein RCZ16_17500 [Capnocytophaga catalasegens]
MKNFVKLLLLTLVWLQGASIYGQCNVDNFTLSQVQGTCASDAQINVQADCKGNEWEAVLFKTGSTKEEASLTLDSNGKASFQNLIPANFQVRVRKKDGTKDSTLKSITTTTTYIYYMVDKIAQVPPTCDQGKNGVVSVKILNSGGTGPYKVELLQGGVVKASSAEVAKSGTTGVTEIKVIGSDTNPVETGVYEVRIIDYINKKAGCFYAEKGRSVNVDTPPLSPEFLTSFYKPKCANCKTYELLVGLQFDPYKGYLPKATGTLKVKITRSGAVVCEKSINTATSQITLGTSGYNILWIQGSTYRRNSCQFFKSDCEVKEGDQVSLVFDDNCPGTTDITADYLVDISKMQQGSFSYNLQGKVLSVPRPINDISELVDNMCKRTGYRISIGQSSLKANTWNYWLRNTKEAFSLFCEPLVTMRLQKDNGGGNWTTVTSKDINIGDFLQGTGDINPDGSIGKAPEYLDITADGKYKIEVFVKSNVNGADKSECKYFSYDLDITGINNSVVGNLPVRAARASAWKYTVLEGTSPNFRIDYESSHNGGMTYSPANPLTVEIKPTDGRSTDQVVINGPWSLAQTHTINYPIKFQKTDNEPNFIYDLPAGSYEIKYSTTCLTRTETYTINSNPAVYNPVVDVSGGCRGGALVTYNMHPNAVVEAIQNHYAELLKDNSTTGALGKISHTEALSRIGSWVAKYTTREQGIKGTFRNILPGRYILKIQNTMNWYNQSLTVFKNPTNGYANGTGNNAKIRDNSYWKPYIHQIYYAFEIKAAGKVSLNPTATLCNPQDPSTGVIGVEIGSGEPAYPVTYQLWIQNKTTKALRRAKDNAGVEVPFHTIPSKPANGDTYHAFTKLPRLTYTNEEYVIRLVTACDEEGYPIPDFDPKSNTDVIASGDNLCPGQPLVLSIALPSNVYNFQWHSSKPQFLNGIDTRKKRITINPTETAEYWVTYTAKDPSICGSVNTFNSNKKTIQVKEDKTPPTISQVPDGETNTLIKKCESGYRWNPPVVTDPEGCLKTVTWEVRDGSGTVIYTPPADANGNSIGNSAVFPVGENKVIYTATDYAGNVSKMEFKVTVVYLYIFYGGSLAYVYPHNRRYPLADNQPLRGQKIELRVQLSNGGTGTINTNAVVKIQLPDNKGVKVGGSSEIDISEITTPAYTPSVTYDATTRTFTITNIDPAVTGVYGGSFIYFPLYISNDCKDFENACDNKLISSVWVTSGSPDCPTSLLTNVTERALDIDRKCPKQELLCAPTGANVVLKAEGTGYKRYEWYDVYNRLLGTGPTYTATEIGVYKVRKVADNSCPSRVYKAPYAYHAIQEDVFNLLLSNALNGANDPIRSQSDGGATCGNDGTWVSHFYLCDGNSRVLNVTFSSAKRIVWQRYNTSCTYTQPNCQSRADSCWTDITTGNSYTLSGAGDYRLRIEADGCTKDFYFTAYTAGLSGRIDITHQTNFTAGSINVTMNTTGIPYTYTLKEGTTIIQTVTKTTGNTHEHIFQNLTIPRNGSRTFTVEVTSTAIPVCKYTETAVVRDQATLTGTAKFLAWVDCDDANFEFEAQGGKRPYKVAIYSIDDVELHPGITLENIPLSAFTVSGTATQSIFQGVFKIAKPGSRYKFVIRDADGKNVVTNEVTVPYNPDYQIITSFDPIECAGKFTTVTAKFVNPLPQRVTLYRIASSGTRTQVGQNNSGIFPNVPAGRYVALVEAVFASHKCSFEKEIIITEPSDPLVGYAGIVKDILCDTSIPKRYEVHINNVSGGKPPYQYSFDSGNTWQSSPIGFISNTTKVLVRDTSKCDPLEIDVVVDPAIVQPNVPFNPNTDITYDCDGNAKFTITPQAPGGKVYTYEYSVDNGPRQTGNVFVLPPKPSGDPYIINIYYKDTANRQRNILFTEDFGKGDDVCNPFVPVLTCAVGQTLSTGTYIQTKQPPATTEYISPSDASGTGRYLALVTSARANILFEKTINNVIPGKEMVVSLRYINLLQAASSKADPSLRVELVIGGTTYTRTLPVAARGGAWSALNELIFNEIAAGNTSNTSAVLRIVSGTTSITAVGLDEIDVSQPTETCQKPVTLSVTPKKGQEFKPTIVQVFDAECNGGTGKVIVEAKNLQGATSIEYSIDNGLTWNTANLVPSTTNRFELINLSVGTHTIIVRRDADCVVNMGNVTIGEPAPITIPSGGISATPIGCVAPYTTSIVTLQISGGKAPYQLRYRLQGSTTWLTTGSSVSGSVGTIVGLTPGTYEFNVQDVNNCGGNDSIAMYVIPDKVDVTISTDYTQCYSGLGDAFITITAHSGAGNYEFSKDNGVTFERPIILTSNVFTFDNLSDGTYQIVVRDRYGCTATESVTIYKQLTMQLDTDGGFSCKPNAEEKITLRVEGGKDAKTFKWRRGATGAFRPDTDTDAGNVVFNITNAGSSTTPATATVTIKTAGEYYFMVEDSNTGSSGLVPCNVTKAIIIENVKPEWKPSIVLAADDIACSGASTGFIGVREAGVVRPIDLSKDIDATKGVPPFRVEVYKTGTTTPNVGTTNLAKGTYIVRLIDSKECYVDTTVTIGEVPAVNLTLTKQDITCSSGTSVHGKITATWSSGGTAPFSLYVYNSQGAITRDLDTGAVHQVTGRASTDSYTFSGFAEGTYTLVMIDAKGCRTEKKITIGGLTNELVVEPQVVTDCKAGGGSAKLITYNKNGTPIVAANIYFAIYRGGNPATYAPGEWNQATTDSYTIGGTTYPAASYTMTGLIPGVTYQFVVRNNGCYEIFEKNIPLLTNTTTKVDSVTGIPACGTADGKVSFTLSGMPSGVTSIGYQVYKYPENTAVTTAGASGTIALPATFPYTTAGGLDKGQYYIVFTETPTNCVTASKPFTILASDVPLGVILSLVKNETCNTSAELSAVITGGTADFKYIFKNVNTPPTTAEWAAVTATANRQKTFNTNVSVTPNPTWYVFVQDKYGCVGSANVPVIKDNVPIINTVTPENLCGANGQYRIRVKMTQTGVGQHYYTITRGGVTSTKRPITIVLNEFVVGDIYSDPAPQEIKVYDQNNCESVAVSFTILDKVTYDLKVTRPITCDPTTPSGQVTISNIQNFDPSKSYFYRVDYVEKIITIDPLTGNLVETETITPKITATAVTSAGTSFNVTDSGIYRVYIDENTFSCPIVRNVVVQPKEIPVLNVANVIDEKCSGTTAIGNGVGAITVTAGSHTLQPFAFKIVSAVDLTTGTNVPIPSSYSTYTSTTIANVVDISMNGTRATFQNLMGTPTGVRYEIQAKSINVTIYNGVTITQSCESITVFATVRSPQPITIASNAVKVTQFACNANQAIQDAKIEIDTTGVSGGNGDYTYIFLKGTVEVQRSKTPSLTILDKAGGTYTIKIVDKEGCEFDVPGPFVINPYASIETITVTQTQAITCAQGENISISITTDPVVPTAPNYTYYVQNLGGGYSQNKVSTAMTETFTGLPYGTYKITVRDNATGCEAYTSYDVKDPNTFVIKAENPGRVSCYGGNDGTIDLIFVDIDHSNGDQSTGGFSYTITSIDSGASVTLTGTVPPGTNKITVSGLRAGLFKVVATSTSTGCTTPNESQFSIGQAQEPLKGSASLEYDATCTNNQGEILVEIVGGVSPYKVTITGTNGYTQTVTGVYYKHLFTGLSGGATPGTTATYTITVEDAWGCTNVTINTVDITHALPITAMVKVEDTKCEGGESGSIEVLNPQGGAGATTFYYDLKNKNTGDIYPAQRSPKFENLPKGEYTIGITDRWGCTWTRDVTIKDPDKIEVTEIDKSSAICYDELTGGYITIQVKGGTPGTKGYTVRLVDADTKIIKQELLNVQPNTNTTINNLRPEVNYEIQVVDPVNCEMPIPYAFVIPFVPDLTTEVKFVDECNNNTYEGRLEVKFKQTLDWTKVSYTIGSSTTRKTFDSFSLNYGYINNPPASINMQILTIYYQESATKVCTKQSNQFFVRDVQPLDLEDVTDRGALDINEIKIQGKFGVEPYNYAFNGASAGTNNVYLVKRTDPDVIVPSTPHTIVKYPKLVGKTAKLIKVQVTDALGCTKEIDVYYKYIDVEIPRYFTPNGDGTNDEWMPKNTNHYPNMTIDVIDRYGRFIKHLRKGESWDGKYQEKDLPTGDYWYIFKLNSEDDPREFKGHFTLYR